MAEGKARKEQTQKLLATVVMGMSLVNTVAPMAAAAQAEPLPQLPRPAAGEARPLDYAVLPQVLDYLDRAVFATAEAEELAGSGNFSSMGSGDIQNISSGQSGTVGVMNGGSQVIYSGGTGSAGVINSGGTQSIRGGIGTANIISNGAQYISSGGSGTVITMSGGQQTIFSGIGTVSTMSGGIQKILDGGESMDVRRKLASAYIIMGEFDKAIQELNKVIASTSAYDPTLDKRLEEAEIGKIDKEIAKDVKSDFSFQVEEITRFVPGELTQEVFDQAFGEGVVKTEEEFRAKIKEEIAARFVADSDYKFLIDIRKVMMEKVGKLEFSDALLKRIMLLNNEEKGEEYVAENYDKSIEELTWHLIKEQLVEANDIKVEQEDVLKMARETTKAQFAQYGMLSIPDDVLDNYAQEMLKKKETINNLVSRVVEVKLAAALKAQVTLENKNVSIEEFNKMFE